MGCGIVGISNTFIPRQASFDAYVGGKAVQHRGQESAGIAVDSGYVHRGMGEVPQVFTEAILEALLGNVAIVETRYSNTGESNIANAPPVEGFYKGHRYYFTHNGNIINARSHRRTCESAGIHFEEETGPKTGPSDTRIVAALLSLSDAPTFLDAILEILPLLQGSFCFIFLYRGTLIAVRDRFGFHPLQLGRRKEGYVVASESCVFGSLGAELIRDIQPGEVVVIPPGEEAHSFFWTQDTRLMIDIFEFIYFLRPDSIVHGVKAQFAREWMGRYLADEHPRDTGLIIPIPDSGNAAFWGYAMGMTELGAKPSFHPWALFRPHTAMRTFIEPIVRIRDEYLGQKFSPLPELLSARDIVDIDDSRIRAHTDRKVSGLLRNAGARAVHALKAAPVYMHPDFLGIDTYELKDEIDARVHGGDLEAMARASGIDSLAYLSLDATKRAVLQAACQIVSPRTDLIPSSHFNLTMDSFYDAPFTGNYPEGTGDYEIQ